MVFVMGACLLWNNQAFFHDVLTLTPDEMLAYIRCLA
jgi:hypothetical protein